MFVCVVTLFLYSLTGGAPAGPYLFIIHKCDVPDSKDDTKKFNLCTRLFIEINLLEHIINRRDDSILNKIDFFPFTVSNPSKQVKKFYICLSL